MRSLAQRLPVLRNSSARGSVAVWVALGIVVVLVITGSAASSVASSTSSPPVLPLAHPHARPTPIAFLPVHVHPLGVAGPATVDPTHYYSSEPAPMGIGDFGVGAKDTPYSYSTTEFLGNFSWQQLSFSGGSGTSFTDQLNVVLQFNQTGVTYAYWIQDVAFMDSSNNDLTFENNIWNMTTSATCLNNSALSGNGTVYSLGGCQGYYAVSPNPSLPGSSRTMPNPGDFGVLVRSYETGAGVPEVAFEYWDGVTSYYVTYDNVVWPWATAVSADNNFFVDGSSYNPGGWFYDAELAIGGPGDGSSTAAQNPTHINSRLLYWNGHNFEAPPSVWNFGANTAETVSSIQSFFSNDRAGLPLTEQLNGTTRNATPAQAYNQHQVGTLSITAAGITSGTVTIPGDNWTFVNGAATLTLVPGTYHVWVNSTAGSNNLGDCMVDADATTVATIASGCAPTVSTPTSSLGSVDLGQSVTFQSTLESPGSGGDTYVWHTSPTGLGCPTSTSLTLSCTPSSAGTYDVNVTVTDSAGQSSTSGTLAFTVYVDPSVGTPSPSRTSVEVGGSVTFTASPTGGSGSYSYSWTDLPSPCSQTSTATPTCTPSAVATYGISVTVTDSNHESTTSPTLSFSVIPGPSATAPRASPSDSIDVGQTVNFSTTASGGSGVYTYTWSGLPNGCTSTSSPTISCVPDAAGSSSIVVEVVDSEGGKATSPSLAFNVDTDPVLKALSVSPASVDLGQTLRFTSDGTTGGAGGYRYVWSDLPAGCATENATNLTCVPSAAGSGVVKLTVYDANNGSAVANVSFQVDVDPSVAGISASRTSLDLGQNVTFTAVGVAGGSGNYSYAWAGLPLGCVGSDRATVVCSPNATGSSFPTVSVTDSNGVSAHQTIEFIVHPDPSAPTPSATPGTVTVGSTVTFVANASGGAGALTYVWTGLPSGCRSVNASSVTCQPSAAGSSQVTVTVTDSNGVSARSGTLPFTVTTPPATFLGYPTLEGYAILAFVVGLVAVAIGLVAWGIRRRRTSSPS